MKIGLIDVDSYTQKRGKAFPNLALMKISAWHKNQNDEVEMPNLDNTYDKVYMSKVFDETYTKHFTNEIKSKDIYKGGTGYDMNILLPDEIEHIMPDYSLYEIEDKAIGFITRGCPRRCRFCIVGDKEGYEVYKSCELTEFWSGQKEIVLLDPNLTAYKDCDDVFQELIATKKWIDFNQGLDIRFMTEHKVELINKMKIKMLHFAWDNYEFSTYDKLKYFRPMFKKRGRELRVYVLTNFNTTFEQDLERIYKLRELDYDPFMMIYDKPNAEKRTKQMARWVNNKFIWYKCDTFEKYGEM